MNEKMSLIRPDYGSPAPMGGAMPSTNQGLSVSSREVARIQGEIFMAKTYPRNEEQALQRIESACGRTSLAEKAIYQYARGGTDITGPSIRLAETIARSWGNMRYGFEVIDSSKTESSIRAYCYDIETNVQSERQFNVPHVRYTRNGGSKLLDDPRDIYETQANQASRRIRACILEVIPPDITDYAVSKCAETLEKSVKITAETPAKIAASFEPYGVSKAAIEALIQRKLEALTTANYIKLTTIWQSIHDGIGKPEDFFDLTIHETQNSSQTLAGPKKPEQKKEAFIKPKQENSSVATEPGPEQFEDEVTDLGFVSDEDAAEFGF